jgi:hypothetical protein
MIPREGFGFHAFNSSTLCMKHAWESMSNKNFASTDDIFLWKKYGKIKEP